MRSEILFFLKGGEVSRFHTVRTIQEDSVGYHSFGVAWFCHFLAPDARKELILAALAHDLAEQEVGDIPSPTKRALGVSQQLGEAEDAILQANGFHFQLNAEEQRTLKLADCFQGMLFCLRERSLGNRGVDPIFNRYREYVLQMTIKSATRESEILWAITALWQRAAETGEL